jgi:hypothetical protein
VDGGRVGVRELEVGQLPDRLPVRERGWLCYLQLVPITYTNTIKHIHTILVHIRELKTREFHNNMHQKIKIGIGAEQHALWARN